MSATGPLGTTDAKAGNSVASRPTSLVCVDRARIVARMVPSSPSSARRRPAYGSVLVFHSAVVAYFPVDQRASFQELMSGLVADGSCHWISNEAPNVLPDVTATAPEASCCCAISGKSEIPA